MVAIVTGGSSGMGLEFARGLAGRGYDLLLVSNREDDLKAASDSLSTEYGINVRVLCRDLSLEKAADELCAWMKGEGIEPEVLVNDAGFFFFKELEVADIERVQAMINLHVTTVTRLCLLIGQMMKEKGKGYILNVSSMAARIPAPGITVYSATKAYLKSFGRSLSYEMEPYGVKVTTVCPAAIATPLYKLSPKKLRLGVRVGLIRTPGWLAKRALKALFRGRRTLSPAFMNVWLPPLIAALPGPVVARIWKKLK